MEEIDYNWKSILLGYKNLIEPKSIIYHSGGTLEGSSFFKSYFNHRNSMIIFLTNHNTFFMLLILPFKLLLEGVSLSRYLLLFDFRAFSAQICSCIWILSHPIYILKRIIKINKIKTHSLFSIISRMYKPSIVFKYFILRKKLYMLQTDLVV